uniref:Ribosome biogenesis protein NOP53 n=1 Tax=Pseudo-nitzschia australis TaxID=44445 RepID=A0A7S4AFH2_9STRA|mmetsp:Transcript_24753/g.54335  ORF Transcript_24753/g.54335 Transcript_24753/m.54335 type:complete len:434 (-) Transcript_24753:168-1469(-)
MGKRVRGAKLRSKKRGTEAERQIVEKQAVRAEEGAVTEKADEELFVIDTAALVPSKKQLARKEKKQGKEKTVSAKEQTQIQKLVDTHSAKELEALVKKTSTTAKRAPKRIKARQSVPTFDMWADDDGKTNKNIVKAKKQAPVMVSSGPHGIVPLNHVKIGTTKALPAQAPKNKDRAPVTVDLAKSGQSYNPDHKDHRSAIEEALLVETKRDKAEKEAKLSASQGMTPETRALLLGDTDTEDEEDSDDDDDNNNSDGGDEGIETKSIAQKRPEKMTRAQRNKQKRVRAEQYEIKERKRQKRMQHELRGIKSVKRTMRKEELERKAAKEKIEQLKQESERSKGKDLYKQLADENPRYAPSYPVALPGELKSGASLRTIKPKGSLVTDRMVSLMDRGMTAKKQLKLKNRVEGKRRKIKVKGKGKNFRSSKEGDILG